MNLRFLCFGHKQALLSRPKAAQKYWLDTIDHLDSQQPVASPYRLYLAGSALEASELFFASGSRPSERLLSRYQATVIELFGQLIELRQTSQAVMVLAKASAQIEEFASRGLDLSLTLTAIEALMRDGRRTMAERRPPSGVTAPLRHHCIEYNVGSRNRDCANPP